MGLLGILAGLLLLVWLAFRGWSVLVLAPAAALVAAAFGREPLLANWTQTFMGSAATFLAQFFPLFLLGAVFGKLMEDSGSVTAVAHFMTEKLGKSRAMLAVVLAGAAVTYGGVSLFVAFFVLAPMAQTLFRAAGIPGRLMPAAIVLGTSTFTMSALPGTPSIQNAIPMPFFGTTPFAAPGLGILAALIMLGFGLWWLNRAEQAARGRGEGFGAETAVQPDAAADDEHVRERASTAREFDPAEIHHGHRSDTTPSPFVAALPLGVVVAVNLTMSFLVLPRLDFSFLSEERFGGTSISAVAGVWSVVVALAAAIIVVVLCNRSRLPALRQSVDAGANASALPALSVASSCGFRCRRCGLAGLRRRARLGGGNRGRSACVACGRHQCAGGAHRLGLRRSNHRARRARSDLHEDRSRDRPQSGADASRRRHRFGHARSLAAQWRGGEPARHLRRLAPPRLFRHCHGWNSRRNTGPRSCRLTWEFIRIVLTASECFCCGAQV